MSGMRDRWHSKQTLSPAAFLNLTLELTCMSRVQPSQAANPYDDHGKHLGHRDARVIGRHVQTNGTGGHVHQGLLLATFGTSEKLPRRDRVLGCYDRGNLPMRHFRPRC